MSYNQPDNERAAFAPDGYVPVFFGEHENEKNMWVDHRRPAGTAPTVLRGERMSAETEIFVEANHILTGDPVWVAGVLNAPVMGDLPLISQPVARPPGYDRQGGGYNPASRQTAQYSDGMQSYGAGYNDGYRAGAARAAYGHYSGAATGAAQIGYGHVNPSIAPPMAHGSTSFAHQGANNWNFDPVPGALSMHFTGPSAAVPVLRRSRSPVKDHNLVHRRRSPPDLNPMAPSFAPPFVSAPPAHLSYPPLSTNPSFTIASNHNFAPYDNISARNGAWTFGGEVHAATPYQVRRNEAQMRVDQQRRFSPGSDDVRNHIPSEYSGASNEEAEIEDEHESDADEASAEEEEEEESQSSNEEEDELEAPIPRRRHGKFHAGNKRLVCDNCHDKHYKCVKSDPNKPCVGCMKAREGPIECKITRR